MMKKIYNICMVFAVMAGLSSCSEFFNVNPDDVLLEDDYPSTVTELYSGYMGVASTVQAVADKASFLEGLRGDFLEPTQNATKDVVDLYNYNDIEDNDLANPVGYYNIVLNANDYIQHVAEFYDENPTSIDEETLEALVGGAIRYKVWAYLMMAKIYGEAVWIDDPLEEFKDVSGYEVLDFDALITKCIAQIEEGVTLGDKTIDGKGTMRWSTELFPGEGESSSNLQWNRLNPPYECLLAELYLFAGEYQQVVDYILAIIREGGEEDSYQLNKSEWAGEWMKPFYGFYRKESIFMFTYNYNLKQTHHLIDYYLNLAPNQYLMRPSQAAMDRFERQTLSDGSAGDAYRGEGKTYKESNGEWIVNKFSSTYETSDQVYRNDVLITLYKASDIYLWLAEALGQLGRFEEAVVFLDGGIESYYNASVGEFMEPFEGYPSSLYRTGNSSEGACQGIRGRVSLTKVADQLVKNPSEDVDKDKYFLDSLLVEETCLESAGEARSLYAMIRMAKRWNKAEIIADRVSAKYPEAIQQAMHDKLMNDENWFIKYPLTDDE